MSEDRTTDSKKLFGAGRLMTDDSLATGGLGQSKGVSPSKNADDVIESDYEEWDEVDEKE